MADITLNFARYGETQANLVWIAVDDSQVTYVDAARMIAAAADADGFVIAASLSEGAAWSDFGAAFLADSSVTVQGENAEYAEGKFRLLDSFEAVKFVFNSGKAILNVTLKDYTKPEKPETPTAPIEPFAYRFYAVDESASIASMLQNQGIDPSYTDAVVSDTDLVALENGVLTTQSYFDEVTLTVTLADGRKVTVSLHNPEPARYTYRTVDDTVLVSDVLEALNITGKAVYVGGASDGVAKVPGTVKVLFLDETQALITLERAEKKAYEYTIKEETALLSDVLSALNISGEIASVDGAKETKEGWMVSTPCTVTVTFKNADVAVITVKGVVKLEVAASQSKETTEELIGKEQAQELGLTQQEKPVQTVQTGEKGEEIIVSTKTESVVLDISPTRKGAKTEKGQTYETIVNLEKNPIALVSKDDAALGEVKACHIQVFHIVDGEAVEVPVKDVVIKDGMLLGFTIVTDGFSPYVVKFTVEFVYHALKAELNLDFDEYVVSNNSDEEAVYENAEKVTVIDIESFVKRADALEEEARLSNVLYTACVYGAAKLGDFDESFFEQAAVSVEGNGVEYADGLIRLVGDAANATVTFTTGKAALEVRISNYTKPEKPVVPEKEEGFSYRFFDTSATVADILAANEIVSSAYSIVSVSDPKLVAVKDGELTAQDYFDEVVLTVSLSDGTKAEIKLNNPAPVKAGETVTTEGVGSFAATGEVPAGTQLVVNFSPEIPKGIVFPGSAKKNDAKGGEETGSETESDPIFFDISLMGPDGKKVQTGASVTISTDIKLPEAPKGKTAKITGIKVYHIGEKGDAEELKGAKYALAEGKISSVSFETPGFSLFAVTYTAAFVDNGTSFSYPGEVEFYLSDMLAALQAGFTAADVTAIEFSNNELFQVRKIEGDWTVKGIQSFTTEETMTLTLADGTSYVIRLTDPAVTPTIDLNVLDANGNSAACNVFTASVSKAVENNEQERNATINFDMHFELTDEAFATLQNASGFPTIVYDLNDYINDPDVPIEEIPSKTQPLYDGDVRIGQVRFENNVMVMTITNLDWLSGQRRFEANFTPSVKIDETKLGTHNEYPFDFPGTTASDPITIHFKEITFSSEKTFNFQGRWENDQNVVITEDADGKYRLNYTVTFNNPIELTSLAFTDTMSGHQTLEGDITVTGPDESTGTVAGSGQSINIDIANVLQKTTLPKGEYLVTYTTVINKEDLVAIGSGTGTQESNSANWRVNGEKDVTPDPIEITPYKDRPPMTVEKKVNDQTGRNQTGWAYGTELNYSISYGSANKPMGGITIWDYMTDNQKISGDITLTYSDGSTATITPNSQATDTNYSTGNVQLFEYQLKDDAGNGPVTVNYKAYIINKEEAIANQVYGTQSVYNQAGAENITSETEGKVTFPEPPVQTKTVSAAQGTDASGNWQLGDTLTYTLTYGSKDIPLAGLRITDSMTKLQNLNETTITITSPNSPVDGQMTVVASADTENADGSKGGILWQPVSGTDFSTEMQTVFDYTFPTSIPNDVCGPITVTYTTTLISQEQVRQLNLSGIQNVINTFTVNNNPVSTNGRVPTNEPNEVTKTVENNTTPDSSTWQPGDSLTYTIVFEGDRLAGSAITDYATDLQYLTSDIVLTDSSNPANTITISRNDSTYIGSDFLDAVYSTESKKLFEYTIPAGWTGPVTATYSMQIIDSTTAADMHLYNLQGVNNSATTDRGGNGGTGKNTDFGEKPVIPQNKTVSPVDTDTDGNEANGWQPGQVLDYILTFGDDNTKMAGYVLTDSMTNLQHLIVPQTTNGTSITGITVTYYDAGHQLVTMEMPASAISALPGENDYDTGLRQLFNFTVPADADKGVVTITYSTQVVSLEKATELRIFGVQNVENRFTADGETVYTMGDVPFKPDPKPTKRVEPVDDDDNKLDPSASGNGWQPEQVLTYTLTFGDEGLVMNNRNIYDEMTNTQTLISDVTVSWVSGGETKSFLMPVSSPGNNVNGVYWELTEANRTYTANNQTLFNYSFPDQTANLPGTDVPAGEIRGPVTVTYQTKVMSAEQAAANNLYGIQPVNNSYTFNGQTATTIGDVPFEDQQTHIPAIRKTGFVDEQNGAPVFPTYENCNSNNGIYQDGQRTIEGTEYVVYDPPEGARTNIDIGSGRVRWIMEVSPADGSVYPLENVTVTDKLTQTMANVGSSYKNLSQLYEMGLVKAVQATVKTQSGQILTPGGDYNITITGTNINYEFTRIDEPVYIYLDVYFHTDVVGWYRMANFAYVNGDESTGNTAYIGGFNSNISATKKGTVVPETDGRIVKWEVSLNPTRQVLDPDVDEVYFSDILPEGMALINYSQAKLGIVDTDNPTIYRTGGGSWNEWKYPNQGDVREIAVTVVDHVIQSVDIRGYNWDYSEHSGLSGTEYDVTYYTWVTDEEWQNITSSESGAKDYVNTALFTTDGGSSYSQTTTVTVETEETEYITKKDISQGHIETVNGEQILLLQGEDLDYIIDVNPHGYIMNNGSPLMLTDRIETSMNLRVPSVRVFKAPDNPVEVTKDNLRDSLGNYNTAVLGQDVTNSLEITYNDDTRMLTFDGIPDGQRYYVVFTAGVRSFGGNEVQTFNNTATLFGSGSHSYTETTKHVSSDFNAYAYGGMGMMKIDENNVQRGLEGGVFELYEVQTTDVDLVPNYEDGNIVSYTATTRSGAEKTYRAVQITVGADENGQYISDKHGRILFGSFEFKPNTLYYWVERQAPEGYIGDLDAPHHFVLYQTVKDEPATTQQNMYKAWALDNYWESEYGIIVASYAWNATWYATNSQYRSITATKKWEGDSNNLYQLRPTDGVKLTLIRIAADGTRTELDTKTIRGGNETYWPSYTWNKLPVFDDDGNEYLYTVEEEPVTDYYAEYSDGGQGIKTGTVTIVNRPTPGKTSIEVEKVWKTGGVVPDSITVKLVQIFTDKDGNRVVFNDSQVEHIDSSILTATLRPDADGKWSYTWNNLPTRDNQGGTYSYTVIETSNLADSYTVAYSDGGNGIVKGKITITNIQPGSLKIKKNVTVNGQPTSGTEADGVYTFNIIDETGKTVKTVSITITNGVAGELKVDGLTEGMYTIREVMPDNGTTIASGTPKEYTLEVKAGKTAEGEIPVAEFTNNKNTTFLTVKKNWFIASTEWPAHTAVTVRLVEVNGDGTTTPVTGRADAAVTLDADQQTYTWHNLDPDKTYTVTEDHLPGFVSVVGEVNNRQTVTITNKEVTSISFQKTWQGTPPENWVAEVKLMQRERMIVQYGNTVSPVPAFSGSAVYTGQTQYVVDSLQHSFDNLPKYRHEGATVYEIEYTVEEGEITVGGVDVTDLYDGVITGTMATGYTLTNYPIINIPVEKIWDGGKPEDVASVEFTLYDGASPALRTDGTAVEPITLPVGVAWTAVFEDVPDGHNYTVKETKVTFTDGEAITDPAVIETVFGAVAGTKDFSGVAGLTVTNRRVTVDLPVTKEWAPEPSGDWSVTAALLASERLYAVNGVVLATPGDWSAYSAVSPAQTVVISKTGGTVSGTVNGASAPVTEVNGKYTVTVTSLPLYRVDAQTNSLYQLRYSAEETALSGYTSTVTVDDTTGEITITNTAEEKMSFTVTKEWYNADNEAVYKNGGDYRTITFKVMNGADQVVLTASQVNTTVTGVTLNQDGTVTLTAGDGAWPTATISNLPKENEGVAIAYGVVETATTGQTENTTLSAPAYKVNGGEEASSASAHDGDGVTIVNKEIKDEPGAEYLDITLTKVWKEGDAQVNPPTNASAEFRLVQLRTAKNNGGSSGEYTVQFYDADGTTLLSETNGDPGDELTLQYTFTTETQVNVQRWLTYYVIYQWGYCSQLTRGSSEWKYTINSGDDENGNKIIKLKLQSATSFAVDPHWSDTDSIPEPSGYTQTITLPTDSGAWTTAINHLKKSDADYTYSYYLEEVSVFPDTYIIVSFTNGDEAHPITDSGSVTVTNRQNPEYTVTTVTVQKVWQTQHAGGGTVTVNTTKAGSAKFQLHQVAYTPANGAVAESTVDSAYGSVFSLSDTDSPAWTKTFTGLPATYGSTTYTYYLEEVEVPDGVTVEYAPAGNGHSDSVSSGTITVTNTESETSASLIVTKTLQLNGQPDTAHDSEAKTFYVGLFTDAAGTTRADADSVGGENPKSITVGNNASSGTAEFTGLTIGETYYVFETDSTGTAYAAGSEHDGYTVTYGTQQVTIAASGNEASVTNNKRLGDISLTKTVSGQGADDQKEFTFTVTILNAADDNTNTAFAGTFGDATFTTGVATLTLKHGDTKTVTNLPAGTRYQIEESNYSADNYAVNAVTVGGTSAALPYIGTITGGTAGANSSVAVNVDNAHTVGSFNLTKTLYVNENAPTEDNKSLADGTYTFSLYKDDGTAVSGYTLKDGNGGDVSSLSITITDGTASPALIQVGNLPAGSYIIAEDTPSDGTSLFSRNGGTDNTVTVDGKQGIKVTVTSGDPGTVQTAAFVNNKPVTGKITVTKTVQYNGQPDTDFDGTFRVGISETETAAAIDSAKIQEITVTAGAGTPVEFDGLTVGNTYYIYEVDADGIPVTSAYEYTVTGSGTSKTITYADLTPATIEIINNKVETGSLTVNKEVWYNGAVDTTAGTEQTPLTFKVAIFTLDGSNYAQVGTAKEISVVAGETLTAAEFDGLTIGTTYYAFELDDTDQRVGDSFGSYTVTNSGASFTPARGSKTGSLTIKNAIAEEGSLTVTKHVQVNGTDTAVSEDKAFIVGLYEQQEGGTWTAVQHEGSNWTATITVDAGSATGEATFSPLTIGKTYRVYELNGSAALEANAHYQEYTVSYDDEPAKLISRGNANSQTANIYNDKETLNKTALKRWVGNATPPADATVKLKITATVNGADVFSSLTGVTGAQEQTLPNGTSWEASWSNLPKYYQGVEIAYTVEETEYKINGVPQTVAQPDATAAEGYDFSFTNTLPTTNVTVTKTWSGSSTWPDNKLSVEMTLKENGADAQNLPYYNGEAQTATVALTSTESTKTWHDLPVYDASGAVITYTVEETGIKYDGNPVDLAQYTVTGGSLTNGTATIDNTPVTIGLTVNKQWLQNGAALTGSGILPNGSITVKVEQSTDNRATWSVAKDSSGQNIENVQITSADNWTKTWSGLPKYTVDGTEIQYRVTETAAQMNAADALTVDSQNENVPFVNGLATLRNPLPKGSIIVEKHWTVEDPNAAAVLLKLYRVANGVVSEVVPTADNVPAANLFTDSTGTYIKIVKDGNTWPGLTVGNLPRKVSIPDSQGQDQVYDCYYFVEEVGYLTATATAKIDLPSAWAAPAYTGGTGTMTLQNKERRITAPETTVTAGHELIVTNTLKPGSLNITKVIETGTEGADTFTFQVVLTPAEGVNIDPNALQVTNGQKESAEPDTPSAGKVTLILTISNAEASNPQTATISGIPAGTTYEVTEINLPDGWYQAGAAAYNDTEKTVEADETADTVTITNKKALSISVTKVWTVDGQPKRTAPSIEFELHQVLKLNGDKKQDRVYTGISEHPDGKFTVTYDGTWETVTITGLPLKDTATVSGDNGETTTFEGCDAFYYVVETQATPDAGYVLETTYSNTATNPVNTNGAVITITNTETPGVVLPSTGGPGTAAYTLSGLALMLGAIWMLLRGKREQN